MTSRASSSKQLFFNFQKNFSESKADAVRFVLQRVRDFAIGSGNFCRIVGSLAKSLGLLIVQPDLGNVGRLFTEPFSWLMIGVMLNG